MTHRPLLLGLLLALALITIFLPACKAAEVGSAALPASPTTPAAPAATATHTPAPTQTPAQTATLVATPTVTPTHTTVPTQTPAQTATPVATPQPGPAPALTGIVWQWQRFEGGDGSVLVVDAPDRYTLHLLADGTLQARVDCNRGHGRYTQDGSSLQLDLLALTRAMCPPGSLHDRFLRDLADARTFVLDGDTLVLNLWADAGNMVFSPAATEP